MEEKTKFECIFDGAKKQQSDRKPRRKGQDFWDHMAEINSATACQLAMLVANLTSANKDDRERAKKEVRELVKIGKEAQA